jgi:phage-related protein
VKKRKLILGTYDTDYDGLWTLAALELTDPEYQANFQEVPGRDGPLDLSTANTDGEPRYGSRTLSATLESSEGSRQDRQDRISEMVNQLDGRRMNIRHPDYPARYLTGRVQVKVLYNDMAHAAVTVTAICDPWLYNQEERAYTVTAGETAQLLTLTNAGRRVAVPQVIIEGTGASVLIEQGTISLAMGPGTYKLPDLLLPTGDTLIKYSGTGVAKISYREAVLR